MSELEPTLPKLQFLRAGTEHQSLFFFFFLIQDTDYCRIFLSCQKGSGGKLGMCRSKLESRETCSKSRGVESNVALRSSGA